MKTKKNICFSIHEKEKKNEKEARFRIHEKDMKNEKEGLFCLTLFLVSLQVFQREKNENGK